MSGVSSRSIVKSFFAKRGDIRSLLTINIVRRRFINKGLLVWTGSEAPIATGFNNYNFSLG